MKKKGLAMGVLAGLCLACIGAGCGEEEKAPPVTVEGLDGVQAEMQVTSGSIVALDIPIVVDSNGNIVDVWVEVVDSQGGYVPVSEELFTATDLSGYTIYYVVRTSDGGTFTSSTKVNVVGSQGAYEFTVAGLDEKKTSFLTVGEAFAFAPEGPVGTEYEYEVKKGGESVSVDGDTFLPLSSGEYTVTVKATLNGKQETNVYKAYARNRSQIGEVEVFDETWTDVAKLQGDARTNTWKVVETGEENAPTDRNGEGASFLTTTTNKDTQYLEIPVVPRNEKGYYEDLLAKGYTHVSLWLYLDAENAHGGAIRTDPNGRYYQYSIPAIQPKTWTQIKFQLTDRTDVSEDYYRSFLTCFDFYNNPKYPGMHFMNLDNAGSIHEDEIKVYMSDIHAVKDWTPTTGDTVLVEKSAGMRFDTSLFDTSAYEDEFTFSWALDGKPVLGDDDFKGLSDGFHELSAIATGIDSGHSSTAFTMTVDAYDKTAPSTAFAAGTADILGTKLYAGWDGDAKTTVLGDFEDKTNVVEIYSGGQSRGATVNALHSQAYYEWLLANAGDKKYYVTFDYKVVGGTDSPKDTVSTFDYAGKETLKVPCGEWKTEKYELSLLVDRIEAMRKHYREINDGVGQFSDILIGVFGVGPTYLYITLPKLVGLTPIQETDGGVLLKKSTESVDLSALYNTAATAEYTFAWQLDGEPITSLDLSKVSAGAHDLTVAATSVAGATVTAYRAVLDVYDGAETAPVLVNSLNEVKGVRGYVTWGTSVKTTYGTQLDGKDVVKITTSGETLMTTVAKPLHTYAYYEMWANSGKSYSITYEYYMPSTTNWNACFNYKGTEANKTNAVEWGWVKQADASDTGIVWSKKEIPLNEFLAEIEDMRALYADSPNGHYTTSANHNRRDGQMFGFYIGSGGFELYMTMPTIVENS